jgi:ribonuclease R
MTQPERETVMQVLREQAPRALHLGEICKRVGVKKRRREEVLDLLDELVDLGMAREMPGRRFRTSERAEPHRPAFGRGPASAGLPRSTTNVVHGRLTQHPRGFAFVATEEGGPDVFIPPDAVNGALHTDYVAVQAHPTHKGREGRVVEVRGRGLTQVSGTVQRRGRSAWLEPDDARIRGPLPIHGRVPREVKGDMAVLARFVRYPEYSDELPEVEIVQVLGRHGELEVEVQKTLVREGVVEVFSEATLSEVDPLPERVLPREIRGREDLRDTDLVTIDPADARDHDDAVWAQRTRDGNFRIIVAIADVSHYVQEGTTIDQEAFARGCTVYLPDRAIPMLPAKLSTDLASLVAGEDRLCMAVEIELTPTGSVKRHRFIEGVMRSRASLHYEGVARALGLTEEPDAQPEAEERADMLHDLLEAAKVLRRRRQQRGSLDFDLPEAKIVMDEEEGVPLDAVRSRKDPGIRQAYRMIEDLMVLANEVVAQSLHQRGVPTIYRVHGPPDEDKVELFAQLATSLGYAIDPEDAMDPKKLSQFLRKVDGSPYAPVLNYLLLRAMQQANYDTTNIGHFGLASKDYLHFTSPIRRYPDLVVHRVVRKVIHGETIDPARARPELRRAAAESSRLERRAMVVERDVVDLYRASLMQDRVGEEFDAAISHVVEYGFYSALDDPFVEVFTPLERLTEDFFELDTLGLRLVGKDTGAVYSHGDRIRLRIEEASLTRREIVGEPVQRLDEGDHVGPQGGTSQGSKRRRGDKPRGDGGGKRRRKSARGGGAERTSGRGRSRETQPGRRRESHAGDKSDKSQGQRSKQDRSGPQAGRRRRRNRPKE